VKSGDGRISNRGPNGIGGLIINLIGHAINRTPAIVFGQNASRRKAPLFFGLAENIRVLFAFIVIGAAGR